MVVVVVVGEVNAYGQVSGVIYIRFFYDFPINEDICCKAECDQPYFVALVAIDDKLWRKSWQTGSDIGHGQPLHFPEVFQKYV